ncbi:MAG TPA: type II secretion system F family protein [Verrucomicrobiae bacterium]|nr:type II secretion system F family protein [Verrucomicrobiae bacterium]
MLFAAFIIFLLAVGVLMALVYASSPQTVDIGRRLSRALRPAGAVDEKDESAMGSHRAENVFVAIGKIWPPPKGKKASQDELLAIRAGYRSENAVMAVRGARLFFIVLVPVVVIWTGLVSINPIAFVLLALLLGWMIPEIWLILRIKARQKRLRLSLPDAMDLMVICVEVGLGLDQALLKVADEIAIVHPELSAELHMVSLEMRVGKTRLDALRDLAHRTGLDDIKALVAILAQTDRFGTSIVQSLRTFSDELRTKRRQRAEEMSAKVSVKMVPVLVFFIFPALLLTILGPAVIIVKKTLFPLFK